jgi:hypothetical protein
MKKKKRGKRREVRGMNEKAVWDERDKKWGKKRKKKIKNP